MSWSIKFLDSTRLDEQATKAQASAYRAIKQALSRQKTVTVGEILSELGLNNPNCLISRLKHLEEKGFLILQAVRQPAVAD